MRRIFFNICQFVSLFAPEGVQ